MRNVIIGGIGMTPFGKFLDRNLKSLSEEAARLALRDAGATPPDVDRVFFGNAAAGVVTGQEMIRAQSSLRNTGLAGKPMFNDGSASAQSALSSVITTSSRLPTSSVPQPVSRKNSVASP